MGLNLHNIVRGAITAVNPDMDGFWLASTGSTPTPSGGRTPLYADPVAVRIQSQPPSGEMLKHEEFLNVQGVIREVWMYGNPQAVVRVTAKGGDLLQFPQNYGGPNENWLVRVVAEQGWNLTDGSWSHVGVVLQAVRPS